MDVKRNAYLVGVCLWILLGFTFPAFAADHSIQTLEGHSNAVYGVAFSPDGQLIASASWDGTVKIWNSDGTLLRTLQGHQGWVFGVAFSPDGQTLASASFDKTVKLWRVSDGTLMRTLAGHTDWVFCVAFSPDGMVLASGSQDHTVKVWRASDGKLIHDLENQGDAVIYSVAFSPDSRTLAAGIMDKTIKLFQVSDGTLLRTVKGHTDSVYSVAFSPNGQFLASGSLDSTVRLWLVADGTLLRTLEGHADRVTSVGFSPDGQTLASGSVDKAIKLWKLSDGSLIRSLEGHTGYVFSVAFQPNGKILASGSDDHTVKLWDPFGNKTNLDWLVVLPTSVTLKEGQTQGIVVTGIYSDGTTRNVTKQVSWQSSDNRVATANGNVVTAVGPGTTTLTASLDGQTSTVTVKVYPKLLSIIAIPSVLTLQVGGSQSITLTGLYSDRTQSDVARNAIWTSSNNQVAKVKEGLITAVGSGLATLTASLDGKSATVMVTVPPPPITLEKLDASIATATIQKGKFIPVKLDGVYSDDSHKDVTKVASWVSANEQVAIFSDGVIQAVSPGKTVITASLEGMTAQVEVTVIKSPDEPDQLVASETSEIIMVPDQALDFKVYAKYGTGAIRDVTFEEGTSYYSSSNDTVTVTPGRLRAHKLGHADITVRFQDTELLLSVMVKAQEEVNPIVELIPNPLRVEVEVGSTKRVTVKAKHKNGQEEDVTGSVIWRSNDTSVATVDSGVVTGIASGTAVVSVHYLGVTGIVNTTVKLPPELDHLELSDKNVTLLLGQTRELQLWAIYKDKNKEDVTTEATWSSDKTSVVDVVPGKLIAQGVGKTIVRATYRGESIGLNVNVRDKKLTKITVNKASVNLKVDQTFQLAVKAIYEDKEVTDITANPGVEWKIKGNYIDLEQGLIRALKKGNAVITINYGGRTVSVKVNVT